MCQDVESLARIGLKALNELLTGLDPQGKGLDAFTTDLVCHRITGCILRNLCLDFGDSGVIKLNPVAVPPEVRRLLSTCPISARRRFKDVGQAGDMGSSVTTNYGAGKIIQVRSHRFILYPMHA